MRVGPHQCQRAGLSRRLVVVGPNSEPPEQPVSLPRSFERGQTLYDWRHYVSLLERKPGALRNGAPFKTMPEPLQHLQAHLLRHPGGDRVMAQVRHGHHPARAR